MIDVSNTTLLKTMTSVKIFLLFRILHPLKFGQMRFLANIPQMEKIISTRQSL
jgi:hypothetical protein